MIAWLPVLNSLMLAVLLGGGGMAFILRHRDLQSLRDYDQHLLDLLAALKVLITELRLRPCVMQKVDYKTDGPPESKRRADDTR